MNGMKLIAIPETQYQALSQMVSHLISTAHKKDLSESEIATYAISLMLDNVACFGYEVTIDGVDGLEINKRSEGGETHARC